MKQSVTICFVFGNNESSACANTKSMSKVHSTRSQTTGFRYLKTQQLDMFTQHKHYF